jgi:hypothetical protein
MPFVKILANFGQNLRVKGLSFGHTIFMALTRQEDRAMLESNPSA